MGQQQVQLSQPTQMSAKWPLLGQQRYNVLFFCVACDCIIASLHCVEICVSFVGNLSDQCSIIASGGKQNSI
jgi:hypothetical protein